MANRFGTHFQWTLIKGVTELWGVISVSGTTPSLQKWNYPSVNSGSTGSYSAAATSGGGAGGFGPSAGFEGIKSVARTNTGLWTVTLQDSYQRLLGLSGFVSLAGGAVVPVTFAENTSITSMTATGGSVIGVAIESATATLADPGDGARVTLHFTLQNSTAT